MVGQKLHLLHVGQVAADVGFQLGHGLGAVGAAGHHHVAHPHRRAGPAQRLLEGFGPGDVLPGQRPVGFRLPVLDVVQNQVGLGQDLVQAGVGQRGGADAGGVQAGVDAPPAAQPQRLQQKRRLHQRLAAGKGHPAAAALKVGDKAGDLVHKLPGGKLLAPGRGPGVGVVAEAAAQPAPLQKHHRADARPVHQAHALDGMDAACGHGAASFPAGGGQGAVYIRSGRPLSSWTVVKNCQPHRS